jgi:hypothetical protein
MLNSNILENGLSIEKSNSIGTIFLHEHRITDSQSMTAVLKFISADESHSDSLIDLRLYCNNHEYRNILSALGDEMFDVFECTIEHVNTTPIQIGGTQGTLVQLSNMVLEEGCFFWSIDVLD